MPSTDRVMPDRDTTDVVGARIGAQVVDVVLTFLQLVGVGLGLVFLARPETEGAVRGLVLLGAFTLPLYGGLLEGYWNGQTVGKRLFGIKVVGPRGYEPGFGKALLRNVPAVLLFSWLTSAVALASMAINDHRQRVFDTVADTYVVRVGPGAGVGRGPGSPNRRR